MISALLLAAYAVTAGTLGASWLRESRWPNDAPGLGIAAWQALAASVLLALSAAGLTLAMSLPHVSGDLARLFNLCAENLRHGYAAPGGTLTALLGVALTLTLVVRGVWCAASTAAADRRERRARVAVLDLVGRTDIVPGAVVIDHAAPYAFCVGGPHRRVVLTSGLLATLTTTQLEAVKAHEAAHLRQRHHVALAVCRAAFAALAPMFPAFRQAMPPVRLYAELCADDCARRDVGDRPLHDALMRLACQPAPAGALAATANDVETRLLRLASQRRRLTRRRTTLTGLGIAAAVVVPLALAVAPALALAWEKVCLIG